jgi:superfamily II DNA or RNA helicase
MVQTMTASERKDWVQRQARETWIKLGSCKGTVELATGIGKTKVAIDSIKYTLGINSTAIVHIGVPTETLRDVDWPDEFRKWGQEDLLKKVKIFCHTTMPKVKSKTEEVDLFVWDECHHATPKSVSYFNNNKVYKVLGLSATLPDGTRDEDDAAKKAIIDQYCPSIYKVTIEQAIELELIADFEVKVLKFNLDNVKITNYGTVEKPKLRTELEQYKYLSKQLAKSMFNKKFAGLKFTYMQQRRDFIVNSPSKFALAKTCLEKMLEPGKRTLVFCGSIAQSFKLLGTNVYNSQSNSDALEAFQAGTIDTLGAVDALNEGKNLKDLDQLLIVQGTSVKRTVVQRFGRALRLRPNHKALIVILVAKNTADEKWYHAATEDLDKSRIKEYFVKSGL